MKLVRWIISFIAALQIVASPLFIGIAIGLIVYYCIPNLTGLVLGLIISLAGLIIGIIWAIGVWKKRGTVEYTSEISSTPEFDVLNEKEK